MREHAAAATTPTVTVGNQQIIIQCAQRLTVQRQNAKCCKQQINIATLLCVIYSSKAANINYVYTLETFVKFCCYMYVMYMVHLHMYLWHSVDCRQLSTHIHSVHCTLVSQTVLFFFWDELIRRALCLSAPTFLPLSILCCLYCLFFLFRLLACTQTHSHTHTYPRGASASTVKLFNLYAFLDNLCFVLSY